MIVIKLGGSLLAANALLDCLNRIEQHYQGRAVVIVAGGGVFAEQVRIAQQDWQFNDETAHAMAILAMQQTAWLIKGLKPDFVLVDSVHVLQQQAQQISLWLPDLQELNQAGIAASWDISSDSLAAWLASELQAEQLIVVKAAVFDAQQNLARLQAQGIVDKAFISMVMNARFNIRVIHQQDFVQLAVDGSGH
jgi:aspartokinase-like uncharacterized kinase